MNFGASAPQACPQKTGTTHALATSCEVAAAFNSNGKPAGVLHEFLDRAAVPPRRESLRWKAARG